MQAGKDYIGVGVGALVFNKHGELLLLQRGPEAKNERGCWHLPGGAVDFGETLAQALMREVEEELGVDIVLQRQLTAVDHFIPADGQHWVTNGFVAKIAPKQKPRIMEPHKHVALGWFKLDDLPSPLSISTPLHLQALARMDLESLANKRSQAL